MKKWWFIVLAVIVIVLIWYSVHLYRQIDAPKTSNESAAVQVAKEQYSLRTVDNVESYHGSKAFVVIEGTTEKDGRVFVFVGPKHEVKRVKVSDGVTENDRRKEINEQESPKEWVSLKPGIEDDQVVWEAVYIDRKGHYTFDYANFKTGERYKKYSLNQDM
ncbi:hypothetical protein A374_03589 [Fictibacillus macauensis ZFHKF-1]|uniref:Cell wall elongation regulator TseB-like domain-containing protein n=1 Tax=Fictibacillus macauensis ZFHKF-1 TaxID=1196324 RepID=I8AL73_9BACL|nr:DUF5590 domain-containing protein [Fictibacillus macauensis]EIT86622.1 hypothetical protein A374_03589 [Fictibacillus macauensis ZFHKF-1]